MRTGIFSVALPLRRACRPAVGLIALLACAIVILLLSTLKLNYTSKSRDLEVSDGSPPSQGPWWQAFNWNANPDCVLRKWVSTGGKQIRRRLTFYNGDNHAGTAVDLTSMVLSRGGNAVTIVDMVHTEWMNKVEEGRWRSLSSDIFLVRYLSRIVQTSTEESVRENIFQALRETMAWNNVDAIICSMPSSLCEALLSFNTTVIFAPGYRFTFQRCSMGDWRNSITILQRAALSKNPRHYVAALGRYDQEYVKYFTGITPLPLFATSKAYLPLTEYYPSRPEILVGPLALRRDTISARGGDPDFLEQLLAETRNSFATVEMLYGHFQLSDLVAHRAAVVLPYAVMSYGMTELYSLGIPLFFPSPTLMRQRPLLYPQDRTMTGREEAFKQHFCSRAADDVPAEHPLSDHRFSPESPDDDAKFYWLQFADFHQWPHVTFFDSIDDLQTKLAAADLPAIHRRMMEYNAQRETELDAVWATLADGIDAKPRSLPTRYLPIDQYLSQL